MTQAKKTKPEEAQVKEKTSFYLKKETIKGLKYIAFVSGESQTTLLDEALSLFIKQWEKENGTIPQKFIK